MGSVARVKCMRGLLGGWKAMFPACQPPHHHNNNNFNRNYNHCRAVHNINSLGQKVSSGNSPTTTTLPLNSIKSPWLMVPPPSLYNSNISIHENPNNDNNSSSSFSISGHENVNNNNSGGSSGKDEHYFYSICDSRVIRIINDGNKASLDEEEVSCLSTNSSEALCLGSSHGWLAFINKVNWTPFLFNPITGRKIQLPSICTLPITPNDGGLPQIYSIVLSSSCLDADDSRVMVIYFDKEHGEKLAFCCPGGGGVGAAVWTSLQSPLSSYDNIVYSSNHQLFFALTNYPKMESWDLRDPLCPKRVRIKKVMVDGDRHPLSCDASLSDDEFDRPKLICEDRHYLVPDDVSGQFFWVERFIAPNVRWEDGSVIDITAYEDINLRHLPYKTYTFDVYKFNLADKLMTYLDNSLEGRALFIGRNHSFPLAADDFPGLKPNSIYFTDDFWPVPDLGGYCGHSYGGHDLGIYNYEDKAFEPCYFPCDYKNIQKIEPCPVWFTPNSL